MYKALKTLIKRFILYLFHIFAAKHPNPDVYLFVGQNGNPSNAHTRYVVIKVTSCKASKVIKAVRRNFEFWALNLFSIKIHISYTEYGINYIFMELVTENRLFDEIKMRMCLLCFMSNIKKWSDIQRVRLQT